MKIGMISLFPDMFRALHHGIPGRGLETGLVEIDYYNPRDYTESQHRKVDDRPYGGGPGMVMQYQPLRDTILKAKSELGAQTPVVLMSPQGRTLNHQAVRQLANRQRFILLAGRYEGIDERIRERYVDEEWSLGDYVISGGELAAMVLIDAIIRLIPGALGHEQSNQQDSFANGILDHPHYSRPEVIDDLSVPLVLLSGDHQAIAEWRLKQALGRTWLRRPDLLDKMNLSSNQQQLLNAFIAEYGAKHE